MGRETGDASTRIAAHPILTCAERRPVRFAWRGRAMDALEGETLAAALFANGVRTFGHHHRDGAPQGIFCGNGQCAQCTVIADGRAVKSCMEAVRPGMRVEPADGLPALPGSVRAPAAAPPRTVEVECLVIGAGPAGLGAALELGEARVRTLVVDDKDRPGGKLVLQTHKFFGSIDACSAGTRGIDIAAKLAREAAALPSVELWTSATAVGVFSDGAVGVVRGGEYVLVRPRALLVAAGARERSLVFKGNTLPGVYGAGAFQTLVNRDLVRPSHRLFIVGGGNVGLIAGYHALQAGIEVAGLVEALPECGGYKVHRDKLARLGVPIMTSHTVVSANGADHVESVTVARVDPSLRPVPGTERTFACDTVLVAVGLDRVDEFVRAGREAGMVVRAAGDAEEVAEASAAIFSGRIAGRSLARELGRKVPEVPPEWRATCEVLKSKPGRVVEPPRPARGPLHPIIHCRQEIPCDPCASVCPRKAIVVGDDIRAVPRYAGEGCTGCARCVAICPGLAITLVDARKDAALPTVTLAHEFAAGSVRAGDRVAMTDAEGAELGEAEVAFVRQGKALDRALLVQVRVPAGLAERAAGIRLQGPAEPGGRAVDRVEDDAIVCRCERVTAGEIRRHIRRGVRDLNELKALTRAGMGACGGKTCLRLVLSLLRGEGVPPSEVEPAVERPLFVEVPLGAFCGCREGGG